MIWVTKDSWVKILALYNRYLIWILNLILFHKRIRQDIWATVEYELIEAMKVDALRCCIFIGVFVLRMSVGQFLSISNNLERSIPRLFLNGLWLCVYFNMVRIFSNVRIKFEERQAFVFLEFFLLRNFLLKQLLFWTLHYLFNINEFRKLFDRDRFLDYNFEWQISLLSEIRNLFLNQIWAIQLYQSIIP